MRDGFGGLVVLVIGALSACAPGHQAAHDEIALQQVLTRYIAALSTGDIAAEMKERCSGAQISAGDRELFTTQARQLITMTGITGVRVVLPPGVRIAAADNSPTPINFDYVIVTTGGDTEPLHGAAVSEPGAVRLCGYAQPDVERFSTAITASASVGATRGGPLRGLLPDDPLAGYRLVEDETNAVRPDAPPGRVESWTRAWQAQTYGGARLTVTRYETTALVANAIVASWTKLAADVPAILSVPLIPDAVGVRVSAMAWSWIQLPGHGFQIDLVFLRADDTVVTASVAALPPTITTASTPGLQPRTTQRAPEHAIPVACATPSERSRALWTRWNAVRRKSGGTGAVRAERSAQRDRTLK